MEKSPASGDLNTRCSYRFAVLSFIVAFTACETPQTVTTEVRQSVPFEEGAFQPFAGSGTASIKGSAFLTTRSGDVKVGAGRTVELVPSTPYTDERFGMILGSRLGPSEKLEPRDIRLGQFVRTTVADAQGSFEFSNIPAGEYYLACVIMWEYVDSLFGPQTTGGQAIKKVSVGMNEEKKIVLTR